MDLGWCGLLEDCLERPGGAATCSELARYPPLRDYFLLLFLIVYCIVFSIYRMCNVL